jgi:hypothetical protein
VEQPVKEVYEKPKIRDLGTLQELTAACIKPGTGDFRGNGFSTHSISSAGKCTSTP